jgi:NADPH2:quinone reductase
MAIPDGLDMAHAACLPETYITVWSNLFMRGNLKKAERVLIHGGASGIGTTAVQLARQMGAEIYATAGDDARCRYVETLGARACFNYKSENFEERLAAETNGEGVDVVLDMVAGGYLEAHIRTLKTDGRLVIIAVQGGIKDTLALNNVMRKRLTITGSTLRPQSNAAKSAIIVDMQSHIWGWLEAGHVAPIIQEVFDLKDAAKAHAALEAGQHIGKFVLYVADI